MKDLDLVHEWEGRADIYENRTANEGNTYTVERLLATADTLRLCADQLRILIKDNRGFMG